MRGLSKKKKVKKYFTGGQVNAAAITGLAPLVGYALPYLTGQRQRLKNDLQNYGTQATGDAFRFRNIIESTDAPVGPKTGIQSMRGQGELAQATTDQMGTQNLATLANVTGGGRGMANVGQLLNALNQQGLQGTLAAAEYKTKADLMEDQQDLTAAQTDFQKTIGLYDYLMKDSMASAAAAKEGQFALDAQGITDLQAAFASGAGSAAQILSTPNTLGTTNTGGGDGGGDGSLENDPNVGGAQDSSQFEGSGKNGMRYISHEKGGRTEGEFNHDSNKKAIVDEESGEKEGEMTGGELIFNPQQVADMEKFIAEGDEDGLMAYMKELLSQPQFQEEEEQMA